MNWDNYDFYWLLTLLLCNYLTFIEILSSNLIADNEAEVLTRLRIQKEAKARLAHSFIHFFMNAPIYI